jgi:hypothetical protein
MTTFIKTFKTKAKNKNITAADIIALCIYKTMKAKSKDKATILKHFLTKSFTPGKVCAHRQYPYQAIINNQWSMNFGPGRRWDGTKYIVTSGTALGVDLDKMLDANEIEQLRAIRELITPDFVKGL